MRLPSISWLHDLFLKHPYAVTDTRKLSENCIFFALKGNNFNGNSFAAQALEQGAAYAIIDEASYALNEQYILVDNVLETLQQLAKYHRMQSKAEVLAITGSNGKTTTKELIAAVLKTERKIIATVGNLNNHIGVPLTLLTIRPDTEIALIEMGANHIGEIASYCEWAQPDLGLITNVGKAHLEGFGSLEGVKKAKGELYDTIIRKNGIIFRFEDAHYFKEMINNRAVRQITYGTENADIIGNTYGEQEMLKVEVTKPITLKRIYQTHLVGDYNLPNVLCAMAVADYFNIMRDHVVNALADYQPSNSRSQLMRLGNNQFIMDAYNANPTSLKLAIENFHKINHDNKWLMIGCMKELGEESRQEHMDIVALVNKLGYKNVFYVGDEYKDAADENRIFEDSQKLANHLKSLDIDDALILVKGSRGAQMEEVLTVFEK